MTRRPKDPSVVNDRRKRRLLALLGLVVLIPSAALSWVTLSSVPKQAEARRTSRLREAEKIVYYHERDLEQLARDKAKEAAKAIGVEMLLDADARTIRGALARSGWPANTFDSIHMEVSAPRRSVGRRANSQDDEVELLTQAMSPPAPSHREGEDEITLAVAGSTGTLRFRYSHDFAHKTLLPDYFEHQAAPSDSHWVLRAREADGQVLYESAETKGETFEVSRAMTTPAFQGIVLELRGKDGPISGEVRRWAIGQTALILFLDVLLGAGLWMVYDNVRKEMVLSRLKSDFVANVSHELKTPLALIRLFSETLEMGRVSKDDKAREYYRIINKESQRLTQLINNILDFSRIEAGRKEYRFVPADPARVVDDVVESYRFPIEQQGFALRVSVGDLPEVSLDPDALAQALINLINNGIKYSRETKEIAISANRDGDKVLIKVADRGIGIPRGEQKKIFEKFYRAESSLRHDTKGSGLGLALVRHIMDAHGGDVTVESVPGKGSTFTLVLPVRREAHAVEPETETDGASAVPARERG